MLHILPVPLPWFIVGPMMGLSVVGLYAVANLHLGVSGSFVQFVDYARNRPIQPWRLWFLAGLLIGGALVHELAFVTTIWISPSSGVTDPDRILMSVDFPAPFSPHNACTSPRAISMVMLWSACTPPYDLLMLRI